MDQCIQDVEAQLHASLACEAALEAKLSLEENSRGTQTEDLEPEKDPEQLSEEQVIEGGNLAPGWEESPQPRDDMHAQSEPTPMLRQLFALPWVGAWVQQQPWSPQLGLVKAWTSSQSGVAHEAAAFDAASSELHSRLASPLQVHVTALSSSQAHVEAASELKGACAASEHKLNSPSQNNAMRDAGTACEPGDEYMTSSPAPASAEPNTMSAYAGTSIELRGTSATPDTKAALAEPTKMLLNVGASPEFGGALVPTTATPGPSPKGCPSSPLPSIRCPSTQRLPSTPGSPQLAWQAPEQRRRPASPRSGRKMLQRLRSLAMQDPALVARRLASEF